MYTYTHILQMSNYTASYVLSQDRFRLGLGFRQLEILLLKLMLLNLIVC